MNRPSATVKGILPHCGTAGQAWQAGAVKGRLPLWQRYRQSLHDYSPPTIRGVDPAGSRPFGSLYPARRRVLDEQPVFDVEICGWVVISL